MWRGDLARRFLRSRPVLCLLLLAPLVEYLTGSTQLSALLGNPPIFFIFLGQNLGSYGAAVLLIREAKIRWQKGWASVLLLGAAYGIVNEGVGAGTLFNPNTPGFAGLGAYGHWLGVNWVNVAILIPIVHPLFSVSLPILLLDLALPETRGKSLLGSRGVWVALLVLGVDATATSFFVSVVSQFYGGPVLLGGCLAAIAALVWVSRYVPADLLVARSPLPSASPARFTVLGAAFPWALFVTGGIMIVRGTPPVLVVLALLAGGGLALFYVLRNIGLKGNDLQKVALAGGLVAGLIPMGLSSQLGTGIGLLPVLAGDLVAVLFLRHLWRRYRGLQEARGNRAPLLRRLGRQHAHGLDQAGIGP